MTPTPTEQRPQNPSKCKYYTNGKCGYQSSINRHACCMRIVKPMTECFYFTPKPRNNDRERAEKD